MARRTREQIRIDRAEADLAERRVDASARAARAEAKLAERRAAAAGRPSGGGRPLERLRPHGLLVASETVAVGANVAWSLRRKPHDLLPPARPIVSTLILYALLAAAAAAAPAAARAAGFAGASVALVLLLSRGRPFLDLLRTLAQTPGGTHG